ncbi:MAG: protein-export chaperone SecB [Acholeplasmataceae bacterium]
MEKQVKMKLSIYAVDKMSFMLNKSFKPTPGEKIQIKPIFNREITKLDPNRMMLTLSVSLNNLEKEIPFYLDVQISGVFEVPDWEDPDTNQFIITNATNVLYPYLRTIVTTLTANGNVPPYILPIVNVEALFH